jgi:hypothetical protein
VQNPDFASQKKAIDDTMASILKKHPEWKEKTK